MTPIERQYRVEQFYYREARLLDAREYKDWFALVHPDISYSMPGRSNPLVDNRSRGQQHMISVENELEGLASDGLPFRDENYAVLWLRVDRSYKMNSWAENPPARTRRIIGNVEIDSADDGQWSVLSNFHLFYARPGMRDFFYAGQRRDVLVEAADSFQILRREIVMDLSSVNVPTLGLLL